MIQFNLANHNIKKILSIAVLFLLQACSTITGGPNQKINVDTGKIKGASCKLSNSKGTWSIDSTPGSATIKRAHGDLCIECQKNKLKGDVTVASKTKPTTFGNAILVGSLVWTAIDIGTGSAFEYPNDINVRLSDKVIKLAKKDGSLKKSVG